MKKKTIGIIGPGEHFKKKILPVLKRSNFFKITGILRKKKKIFQIIKFLETKLFLIKNLILFIFQVPIHLMKNIYLNL